VAWRTTCVLLPIKKKTRKVGMRNEENEKENRKQAEKLVNAPGYKSGI